MKKRIALLLAAVLAVGTLATACGGGDNGGSNTDAKVKVGLGAHTSFSSSKSIGEEDHGAARTDTNAQADIHVASVMLDAEGKIVKCVVDAVQVKATVNEKGEMVTDPATKYETKKELGTNYNMKGSSGIGKEWDEQIAAFETWCAGKTVDEIKNMGLAEGVATDEQLLTGCTIVVSSIQQAVVRACEAAVETEATANDTLGLGMTAELSSAANYGASTDDEGNPKDGQVQAYVNFATTTKDADGKITSVLIDAVQAYSYWGADGKLTTDMATEPTTKYNLKEGYNMKPASGIQKEWYEQIDAFKTFITGKTADEVAAIAVDESGYPTDEQLLTGCTMKVAAYKEAVAKALAK